MQITEFPPHFHSGDSGQRIEEDIRAKARSRYWVLMVRLKPHPFTTPKGARRHESSALQALERTGFAKPCEDGRQKIEKRTKLLEVLALKVPFGSLLEFPNQAPWPGRFRESIPVNH